MSKSNHERVRIVSTYKTFAAVLYSSFIVPFHVGIIILMTKITTSSAVIDIMEIIFTCTTAVAKPLLLIIGIINNIDRILIPIPMTTATTYD